MYFLKQNINGDIQEVDLGKGFILHFRINFSEVEHPTDVKSERLSQGIFRFENISEDS